MEAPTALKGDLVQRLDEIRKRSEARQQTMQRAFADAQTVAAFVAAAIAAGK